MATVPSPTPVQQTPPRPPGAPARRRAHPRAKSKTCNKSRNCSPHRNQQYSITALTNGSGTVTERYAYTAYGTPTITDASGTVQTSSADNNRYTYTGREYDEALNLYHYRARMYDSVAGRFCSRDPIRYWDGENLYQNNFTLTLTDPMGLCVSTCQPPTSDDDCTTGGGSFVGRLGTGTAGGIGSDIELVFLANPSRFKDSGGDCCCDEVGFIQVASHRFSYGGVFGDHPDGPYIDNGGRPNYPVWPWEDNFYPHGDSLGKPSAGTVCSGGVMSAPSLGDRPGVPATWMSLGLHPLQYVEQAFEVCAVCKSGDEAGRIYGCISWGYRAQRMPDGSYQYERWAGGENERGDGSVEVSVSTSGGCPSQTWRDLIQ
jgi:RHS repeat-associated protein